MAKIPTNVPLAHVATPNIQFGSLDNLWTPKCLGFTVLGLGFEVLNLGFRVLGLGFEEFPEVSQTDPWRDLLGVRIF